MKKRVALPGRGKRGGARTLVATNEADRWFFLFGFEKSDRANVSGGELETLQALAADLLKLSSRELESLIGPGALPEICHDRKDPAEESNPGRGSRDRA
ncbi:MAG: type II toxin-antitoxin system RelE/ParE family toxin [Burkholderiales bacterium]